MHFFFKKAHELHVISLKEKKDIKGTKQKHHSYRGYQNIRATNQSKSVNKHQAI
jgi:hypothetical protein